MIRDQRDSRAVPRWASNSLAVLFLLALLWLGIVASYYFLSAQGQLVLEISRTGEGEAFYPPVALHAFAVLLICSVCVWRSRGKVPTVVWVATGLTALYLTGTLALLAKISDSYQTHLGEDDDHITPAWALPLVALQICWMPLGGWLTWRLRRYRKAADRGEWVLPGREPSSNFV
jgi:hypothetical protein